MTLDSAVVDCTEISKAGQLSVAIGRVKSAASLEVWNFQTYSCPPPNPAIHTFYNKESVDPLDDCSCCKVVALQGKQPQPLLARHDDSDPDWGESDSEGDEDFWGKAMEIEVEMSEEQQQPQDTIPPKDSGVPFPDFSVQNYLKSLRFVNPETPEQQSNNICINSILAQHELQMFFENQWHELVDIYKTSVGLKADTKHFTSFHSSYQKYVTSSSYINQVTSLFKGKPTSMQFRIMGTIMMGLKCEVLKYQASICSTSAEQVAKEPIQISPAAQGQIRYLAGASLAKHRKRLLKKIKRDINPNSPKLIKGAQKLSVKLSMIKHLQSTLPELLQSGVNEKVIQAVERKQYASGGLTHVKENTFRYFVALEEKRKSLHTVEAFHTMGPNVLEGCIQQILHDHKLFDTWLELFKTYQYRDRNITNDVKSVLDSLLDKVEVCTSLHEDVTCTYISIASNAYKKEIVKQLGKKRSLAHRQEILRSKKEKKDSTSTQVTILSIQKDSSTNKLDSHEKLKACITLQPTVLETWKKSDLFSLCDAYGVHHSLRNTIKQLSELLSNKIKACSEMPHSHIFAGSSGSSSACASTSDQGKVHTSPSGQSKAVPEKKQGKSKGKKKAGKGKRSGRAGRKATSGEEEKHGDDNAVCVICVTDADGDWICCDLCDSWHHTACANLDEDRYHQIMNTNDNWFCAKCSD